MGDAGDTACQERGGNNVLQPCHQIQTKSQFSNICDISEKDDKEMFMRGKKKLPTGIYVNQEFPLEVKKADDRLRPILKLAKSIPELKEKKQNGK